jgi:N-acetylmuramoyl-L-alanine amidase/cell wall-associated NlpC family hydrolase
MADKLPIVVVDPGHGGSADVGGSHANDATGPNGLLEKDLTLDVARRIPPLLGTVARVITTRNADVNLSLSARAHLAKENQSAAFVSIHFDGWTDPGVDGTSIWVAPDASAPSVALAEGILNRLLPVTEVPNRGVQRAKFGVIQADRHDPRTAACLVEAAFLTNPAEARRLEEPAYRQQIAEAIAQGVRDAVAVPARAHALAPAQVAVGAAATGESLGVVTDWFARRLEDYLTGQRPGTIPLDPGSGGRSIAADALRKGDLIVSTTPQVQSIGIRSVTQGPVSHALVYIGDGEVVEAIGRGVVRRSIQDALADDTLAVAFHYPNITDSQAQQVRDYAIQQVGKAYNFVGLVDPLEAMMQHEECAKLPNEWLQQQCAALRVKVPLGSGNDRFFCSQLVLEAYRQAGIPLTKDEPVWHSPDEIARLGFKQLEYVGHLKAPLPGQPFSLAAATGVTLGYGVPGGVITDGFYRDLDEKKAVTGRSEGRASHHGIDVSTSNRHGGDETDDRRGLPVYATIKPAIEISALNSVRGSDGTQKLAGLGIEGQGTATLQEVVVHLQPWRGHTNDDRGGVAGLSCRYRYKKSDGSIGTFTLYLEYLHLITNEYMPQDGHGDLISADTWARTGKGIGFGPSMHEGAHLSAADLATGAPLLVGYLGATSFPHVHIQAGFASGEVDYVRKPRFDPAVMLQESVAAALPAPAPATSHALAAFDYDVPGLFSPLMQIKPMGCWATAAAMLVSWRDQRATYTVEYVVDNAGPRWRRIYDDDTGLPLTDVEAFAKDLGFTAEPPLSYSVQGVLDLLRRFGPLWIWTAAGPSEHIQVMTGLHGDGTPGGTGVWFVDPADGKAHHETFRDFMGRFEGDARRLMASGPVPIQVIHNR